MSDEIKKADLKQIFKSVSEKPSSFLIIMILAGVGFLLLFGGGNKSNYLIGVPADSIGKNEMQQSNSNNEIRKAIYETEQRLERELEKVLSSISGAGIVQVDVNLKSGNRYIWERQSRVNKRVSQQQSEINTEESSSDELVFAKSRDGRDSPVLREELAPEIEGVVVVATGAHNSRIKQQLTQTVLTVLNLPNYRVLVLAGEIRKEE